MLILDAEQEDAVRRMNSEKLFACSVELRDAYERDTLR